VSANKPNISQIRKYLNGELDARAMHELERQALDDPFLADALEGYALKGDQQHNLTDLQKRLQRRTAPTRKRLTLWPSLTIAASVLLFVAAGGWWLVNSRSSNVQSNVAAPDKTIVKNKPVMPAVKAPLPKADSAVLKPASPKDLMIADNSIGSVWQKNPAKAYAPPEASMAPEPQAKSEPAAVQDMRADGNAIYSPQPAQQLAKNKATNTVGSPGSNAEIRIRGSRSVAGKEPLYVVDGKIYQGNLSEINPKDIESISTLKDASSAAVYGSRAANGVLLITTKRGSLARLKSDSLGTKNMLADVVITGYPAQHKASITGSVASVKPAEIQQELQGTAAGVIVSRSKKQKASDTLRTISGRVLDKDGSPLPGVSVMVANKNYGAQTDANGQFKIRASNQDELMLGYIGYESKRLKVKGKDSLNISLNPSSASLSEVVVTGYGNPKNEAESARPQNGWRKFNQYLKENAKPVNGKTGVVRLSFVVNANHTLSDFKILKSLNPETDKAAIKLIQDGPDWLPNTNAKPETVRLRIRFKK
jgi:TonB-dependent SusC/RagA subfamily outer membrane receptor